MVLFSDEKVCYCEHKDKGSPKNGIMCGYNYDDASFTRNEYCQTGEVCSEVGKDDSKKNRVSVDEKGSLCTKGRISWRNSSKGLIQFWG